MITLSRYVTAALCLAIQPVQVSFGQGAEQNIEAGIRAAWKERNDLLKSFQCTCTLTRIDMNETGDLFDPVPPGIKGGPVDLDSTFTLSMEGAKISLQSKSEQWINREQSRINQSYSRCFDGASNKVLIDAEHMSWPAATLDDESEPCGVLTKNTHYAPLWLSFSPGEMLTRLNFDTSSMAVTDGRAFYQGRECIEVAIPRRQVVSGHVFVVPSLGYLPVKFVEWRGVGRMRSDIEIVYEENAVLGSVVSRWTSRLYGGDGEVETSLSGTVESVTINEPISDDVFDIALPVGTRIRQTLDGTTKYFIQEANGIRRETRASHAPDRENR